MYLKIRKWIFLCQQMTLDTVICSYRENPYSPRRAISKGGGGGSSQVFFFPGLQVRLMSKLSVILLLISVSNQKLLF